MRVPLVLVLGLALGHPAVATEPVEEIVAVVGDTPLLLSDLALATVVRLVEADPAQSAAAYRSSLLDARIRLELQFRDLEGSGTLYRLQLDVAATIADLQGRAGGEAALRGRLAASGLSWSDVEELALRLAATNAFVHERLRPRISVSLEELEASYQTLVDEEFKPTGLAAPPLVEVTEQLHRLVVERKLNQEIESWLAQARERLEVTRFHP